MRQSNICAQGNHGRGPLNVAVTAPSFTMLNVSRAWEYWTGERRAGGGDRHRRQPLIHGCR